jgi:transcriptional regulator with XRE-family HTH domain
MGKYETRGEAIKALRKAAGLSQEELADKLGTTKQTIYKYEAGIVTNIPSDKIELMSQIFGVSPAVIMGWDEDEAIENRDETYYLNPEAAEMANELFHRPEMRILFDASRKLTKEDIEMVTALVEKMSGK